MARGEKDEKSRSRALVGVVGGLAAGLIGACGAPHIVNQCSLDDHCNLATGGQCIAYPGTGNSWCSYPDTGGTCPSGRVWSDVATGDGLSGTCVEISDADAGVDAAFTSDARDCPTMWVVTPVDESSIVGVSRTGIVVDSQDGVHISYRKSSTQSLEYAHRAVGGTWTHVTVEDPANGDDVGSDSSIALDADDGVHISYRNVTQGTLHYAAKRPPTWSWMAGEIDGSGGSESTIRIVDGLIHIGFHDEAAGASGALRLRYKPVSGPTWLGAGTVNSTTVFRDTAMAVGTDGRVYFSYYHNTMYQLWWANSDGAGSAFSVANIDSTVNTGRSSSIAVDSTHRLHVSYSVPSGVYYRTKSSTGSWSAPETIDAAETQRTSLAVDGDGGVHVAYHVPNGTLLKYAYRAPSGGWSAMTIPDFGGYGSAPSLALDSFGGVHVSFYNSTENRLKHAYLCRD